MNRPVPGGEAREQVSPDDRPATGLPLVDEALARLDDLDQRPVSEHHAELAAAHETLHAELESPSGPADGRG